MMKSSISFKSQGRGRILSQPIVPLYKFCEDKILYNIVLPYNKEQYEILKPQVNCQVSFAYSQEQLVCHHKRQQKYTEVILTHPFNNI